MHADTPCPRCRRRHQNLSDEATFARTALLWAQEELHADALTCLLARAEWAVVRHNSPSRGPTEAAPPEEASCAILAPANAAGLASLRGVLDRSGPPVVLILPRELPLLTADLECAATLSWDLSFRQFALAIDAAAAGLTGIRIAAVAATGTSRGDVSDHEREILRHLAGGATVATMARTFRCSERSMQRTLSRVYSKLGASSRSEAVAVALRSGVITDSLPAGGRAASRRSAPLE